jgi:hypothetical protein
MTPTTTSPTTTSPSLAQRLRDLAAEAARLPPPDRRDPERFHIARSELAAELRRLAAEAARNASFTDAR